MDESHVELGKQRDRALVSAAGAALLSRLITTITAVLALAVAARELSHGELGVVAVLTTLSVFLGFGDFGLGTLLMTRLPTVQARGDVEEARRVVAVTFSTLTRISLVITGLGAASAYLLPWQSLLGAQGQPAAGVKAAVLCFFLAGGLSVPAGLGSRVLAAMQRSAVVHIWNAVAGVLALAATIACAATHAPTWAYVAALSGGPAVLAAVQTGWVLTKPFPALRPHQFRFPWSTISEFLRAGSMFAVMSLTAVIAYAIDSLVISAVMGAAAAAVFAVASRIFALIGGTLTLAGQQLWSALADALTRGDMVWVRSRYRRTLIISTSVNAVVCLILVVAGRPLSRLWVGGGLVPPISLLIVLAIWTVYSTAVTQASYLLAAAERVKAIAFGGLLMAPLNLALSILFTHRYGLIGPILGSIVALLIVLTIPVILLTRRLLHQFDPIASARAVVGRHRRVNA